MSKTCTIRVLDEVNCAVLGLDDGHSQQLNKKYSPYMEGYFHSKKYKLGHWDGRISFYSKGGRTYTKLLPEIMVQVHKWGYKLKLVDNRSPINLNIPSIDENYFSDQDIILGDHQVKAANAIFENGGGIVRAGTGAGKTLICAAMAKQYVDVHNLKVLMIVPNTDLIYQGIEDFNNIGLDDVGEYSGDEKDLSHPITISTWQALQNNPQLMGMFQVAIVDECFDGNSKVMTPDGYKHIKDMVTGDKVINYNEHTNEFKIDEVVKLHENIVISNAEKMYELLMDNGKTIKVTGNHKFLTSNRGWVRCDELTEMDNILSYD